MARKILVKDKILEKVPPTIGVFLLILPFVLSLFYPELAAYFIIILNVYFLYRSFAFFLQFYLSLNRISFDEKQNWVEKLLRLGNLEASLSELNYKITEINLLDSSDLLNGYINDNKTKKLGIFKNIVFRLERYKILNYLKKEQSELINLKSKSILNYKEIQHLVIVPHVKEPEEILRETLNFLAAQSLDSKKYINVVLAAEAADPNGVSVSEKLKEEFKEKFNNIWITNHVLQEDEAVGKSANMAWAGREVVKEVLALGWDLKKTTITSCDADSKIPHQYFAYLTYKYVTELDSEYKYYNGALVLYNNIWRLPFYARVKNSNSTIYNVSRLVRTDKLVPFSTYTTSAWLIDQIGYWTPWVTPEDFHMFFKALFKFPNKVETVPIFLKIMSDSAEGEGHWETIKNNYQQERRWAWGVSDDGWILGEIISNWNKFSIRVKYMGFHVVFDHVFGPIGSLLVLIGGNIPPLVNPAFGSYVLGANLPGVASAIVQVSFVFLFLIILLDFTLKPKPPKNSILRSIFRVLEWGILPVVGFFLAVLPGLEAQTRLLFGKYLEYYVTKKKA